MAGHGLKAMFTRGSQAEGVEFSETLLAAVLGNVSEEEAVNAMRQLLKIWMTIQYQGKSLVPWDQAANFVEQNSHNIS